MGIRNKGRTCKKGHSIREEDVSIRPVAGTRFIPLVMEEDSLIRTGQVCRKEIVQPGRGGFCSGCFECRYPLCGFGK